MTTDITELAQSLKAAAEKATPGQWMRSSVQFNSITDIANPMEQGNKPHIANTSEKRDAEFIAMANPANILALVNALEKAQRHANLTEAERQAYLGLISKRDERIAELESRTVKLPKPHAHLIWIQAGHAPDDYWDDVAVSHSEKDRCCDGSERYPVYARWEIDEMLAAAGIKVEAE
ncbi:TPA: ead/Ea22-like family protein [Raoultella planticola]|uniref:ead/Ea22-like family protein n=1 Tax=Raoultella ornithinolytica TaxID=54291 RepID=UPI0037349423